MAADGTILNHPVADHIDPDQCSIARVGELRVYQTYAKGVDVVSKLRAGLECGDTGYRCIPLFSAEELTESQDQSHRKSQLTDTFKGIKEAAGFKKQIRYHQ